MAFWNWLSTLDPETRGAVLALLASLVGTGATMVGVVLTVTVTALLGLRQIGQQAEEARAGRTLEIKRDSLLAGIRGMDRARLACAKLCVLDEPIGSTILQFQEGLAAMTSASAVADIRVVLRGREFANTIGPIVMDMMRERRAIEVALNEGSDWQSLHSAMLLANLPRIDSINKAALRTIAAIRGDIGVDKIGDEHEAIFVASAVVDIAHPQAKVREAVAAR